MSNLCNSRCGCIGSCGCRCNRCRPQPSRDCRRPNCCQPCCNPCRPVPPACPPTLPGCWQPRPPFCPPLPPPFCPKPCFPSWSKPPCSPPCPPLCTPRPCRPHPCSATCENQGYIHPGNLSQACNAAGYYRPDEDIGETGTNAAIAPSHFQSYAGHCSYPLSPVYTPNSNYPYSGA